MTLPFDLTFLHKVATCNQEETYKKLIESANYYELYNLVKALCSVNDFKASDLEKFAERIPKIKSDLTKVHKKTKLNVCVALINLYSFEIQKSS